MQLIKIIALYNGVKGELKTRTYIRECKETKNSYVWDGRRLAKAKVGAPDTSQYNNSLDSLSFYVYSLPENVQRSRIELKECMLKRIRFLVGEQTLLINKAGVTLTVPMWSETEIKD